LYATENPEVVTGRTPRGHFKVAGAADDEVADNLRIPGSPDQLERIAGEKVDRADRRIMAGQQASQCRLGP
jgi:hypothetical protein